MSVAIGRGDRFLWLFFFKCTGIGTLYTEANYCSYDHPVRWPDKSMIRVHITWQEDQPIHDVNVASSDLKLLDKIVF